MLKSFVIKKYAVIINCNFIMYIPMWHQDKFYIYIYILYTTNIKYNFQTMNIF